MPKQCSSSSARCCCQVHLCMVQGLFAHRAEGDTLSAAERRQQRYNSTACGSVCHSGRQPRLCRATPGSVSRAFAAEAAAADGVGTTSTSWAQSCSLQVQQKHKCLHKHRHCYLLQNSMFNVFHCSMHFLVKYKITDLVYMKKMQNEAYTYLFALAAGVPECDTSA